MFACGTRYLRIWHAAVVVLLAVAGSVSAQDPTELKIPIPVDATLRTSDGMTLVATYYPSYVGADAVPIVLLHAANGRRGDFVDLAEGLQAAGHAVLVPDLRGHGESSVVRPSDRRHDLRLEDYEAMIASDMEAVKTYLLGRNNAGELNIERLCIVGVEMGASVALNWAASDWSWPVLATGKQGQDVKALILISPEWAFKGLKIQDAMANPQIRSNLAVLIVTGSRNNRLLQEATRLANAFQSFHPASGQDPGATETIWLRTPATNAQGMRLVNEGGFRFDELMLKFVDAHLVQPRILWSERKNR